MEFFNPSIIFNEKPINKYLILPRGLPDNIQFEVADIEQEEMSHAVLARDSGNIVGFAGLVTSGYFIVDADPGLVELKEIKVHHRFQRNKIGTTLLRLSCGYAASRGKKLILQPFRGGRLIGDERRKEIYPLNDEQLREFYLKNGFRDLFPDEIERLSAADENIYLSRQLWLSGINAATGSMTGGKRSGVSQEEIDKLAHIPPIKKLRLLKDFLDSHQGNSLAIFINRAIQRKNIEKHLIQK